MSGTLLQPHAQLVEVVGVFWALASIGRAAGRSAPVRGVVQPAGGSGSVASQLISVTPALR
ncbi:hypothetical protein [Protofrankia sp. BMG5.30]|uniref:hypothetical protein n=1 Tax=Protofrankia sp. BMG5.30 TaxID=1834514 RepID=UPI00097565B0|nr:hypothetical protein [Protofrankia sp. BMG5.30]ONH31144.1 hypothetical protein BL254_23415 [Protofrankia sp. BMG5.30]